MLHFFFQIHGNWGQKNLFAQTISLQNKMFHLEKNWAILVKLGSTKKVYYKRMFCHNQFSVNNGIEIYIKEPIN